MNIPKSITCKTSRTHSWTLVPTVFVLVCIYIMCISIILFGESNDDPSGVLRIFLFLLMFFGIYFVGWKHFITWFVAEFTVTLEGNTLKGRNLWGHYKEININNIIELQASPTPASYSFKCKDGSKFRIIDNIDFYGFIMDRIIEKTSIKDCNKKQLSKYRSSGESWRYSRNAPFNTDYSKDYLDWLRPQILDQLKDLQTRFILNKDNNYFLKEPDKSLEERHSEWSKRDDL